MTLPLATSVRFAIASFPSLFGTDAGDELRSWCKARGWPLVWSLGLNTGREEQFFSIGYDTALFNSSNRILDGTVSNASTLATPLPPAAALEIELAWADALSVRATEPNVTNATWAAAWSNLAAATPPAARLAPVTKAAGCGPTCFAVDGTGACVCKAA